MDIINSSKIKHFSCLAKQEYDIYDDDSKNISNETDNDINKDITDEKNKMEHILNFLFRKLSH